MMPVFLSIQIPKTMMRVLTTRLSGFIPAFQKNSGLVQLCLFCSGLFSLSVAAQTPSAPNLPDGSRDSYLALGWANEPSCQLGGDNLHRVKAYWQFQWSNGAFVRNTTLGWHLSSQRQFEYGPLLEYLPSCDWSVTGRNRQTTRASSNAAVGGFFNYLIDNDWRFSSKFTLVADAEKSKRLNLELRRYFKPALHHGVSLGAGYSYYQRAFRQDGSRFDPELMAGGEIGDGEFVEVREYKFSKNGVDDNRQLYLNLNWNWELNPSWMVMSSLSVARNLGNTEIGVQTLPRSSHSVFGGIAYRF